MPKAVIEQPVWVNIAKQGDAKWRKLGGEIIKASLKTGRFLLVSPAVTLKDGRKLNAFTWDLTIAQVSHSSRGKVMTEMVKANEAFLQASREAASVGRAAQEEFLQSKLGK